MPSSNCAANSSSVGGWGAWTATGSAKACAAGADGWAPGSLAAIRGGSSTMVWWSLRTLTIARASCDCAMPLAAASIRSKSSWYLLISAGRSGARPGQSMYWRAATVRSTPWATARSMANSSAVALLSWAILVREPGGRPRRRAVLAGCAGSSGWPPSKSATARFPGPSMGPVSAGD